MNKITDLQPKIYNSIIKDEGKGFANFETIDDASYSIGYVLKGMEYRPDLVAGYYLNDPGKAWMITYLNNFINGAEDYILGRKLKIPGVA